MYIVNLNVSMIQEKMMGVEEVIRNKKNYLQILIIFFIPFLWVEWVLEFFFRTSLVPFLTCILAIKIG